MSLQTGARSLALNSAVSKARRWLVPFLLLMYVLAFLDRVNVGFAKQSLQDAVSLSDAAFALGASIFFVSYVLLEVPSNLALHKVFGGPLSGLLLSNLNGAAGLFGYQWMFLIEVLLATLVGVWAYFYLTDRPETADWLTSDEKAALSQTVVAEQRNKVSHGPPAFLSAMADVSTLYFALIFFLIQIGVAVILFFLPSQISKLLGAGVGTAVGFVIAVPWSCALVATFLVPRLAAQFRELRLFGAFESCGIGPGLGGVGA